MMKLKSLVAIATLLACANSFAHGLNHGVHPANDAVWLNNQIAIAAQYPQQLALAAQWYQGNSHIDLHANPTVIAGFNWHPGVVALLYHPQFFTQIYVQPNWQRQWRRGFRGFRRLNGFNAIQVWPQNNVILHRHRDAFQFSNRKVRVRYR